MEDRDELLPAEQKGLQRIEQNDGGGFKVACFVFIGLAVLCIWLNMTLDGTGDEYGGGRINWPVVAGSIIFAAICGAVWRSKADKSTRDAKEYLEKVREGKRSAAIVRSAWEDRIYEYVRKALPDYEIVRNDRSVIPSQTNDGRFLEIDIYIPKLKLGIEANGTAFHDKERFMRGGGPERYKTKYCQSHGIELIHVWDDSSIAEIQERISNEINDRCYRVLT